MNTESMGTGMSGGSNGPGGIKMPIYKLAEELGIPTKDLLTKIHALGIEAKNHMSRLEPEDVIRIKRRPSCPTSLSRMSRQRSM